MKNVLRVEELFLFVLGIFLFNQLDYSWWLFVVLLLTPDIAMTGYTVNNRVGAISYNIFHHRGIAIAVYLIGIWSSVMWIQLAGIILFSHTSLDRIFGYGLKYVDSFNHTHLGELENTNK